MKPNVWSRPAQSKKTLRCCGAPFRGFEHLSVLGSPWLFRTAVSSSLPRAPTEDGQWKDLEVSLSKAPMFSPADSLLHNFP